MHPFMAIWIWSNAVTRAVWLGDDAGQNKLSDRSSDPTLTHLPIVVPAAKEILAADYLYTDIVAHPLPDVLLDRLADLYWTEREGELPI